MFKVGRADQGQILRDILSAVEGQRDRCQRGRWKTRRRNGQEIIVRDVCAKIVACVKKFLSVVDVAVSFDQVHAALPWAGVRFILQVRGRARETKALLAEWHES